MGDRDPKNVCFPADIMLADGATVAEMPQRIVSPRGVVRARPIAHMWRGHLIAIELQGGLSIRATPNQEFLAYHRNTRYRRLSKEMQWVRAQNVRPNDHYLVVPALAGLYGPKALDVSGFVGGEKRSGRYKTRLKDGFLIDSATAWLLGLYVAEGSSSSKGWTGNAQLSLSLKEEVLARRAVRVLRRLRYHAHVYTADRGLGVYLGGPVLSRALRTWCGQRARNKRIPLFILMNRDERILRSFMEGLIAGDGSRRDEGTHRNYIRLHTASHGLDRQVRLALARLGVGHHGHILRQPVRSIRGVRLPKGILYRVDWTPSPRRSTRIMGGRVVETVHHRWRRVPEGIALPVTAVGSESFEGIVYCMGMGNKAYVAEALVTRDEDCHALYCYDPSPMIGSKNGTRGKTALKETLSNLPTTSPLQVRC